MDLSTLERALALHDEARAARLGIDVLALPEPERGPEGGGVFKTPTIPNEELAAKLMTRARALHDDSSGRAEPGPDPLPRDFVTRLLRDASTRLPTYDPAMLRDRPAPPAPHPD